LVPTRRRKKEGTGKHLNKNPPKLSIICGSSMRNSIFLNSKIIILNI